MKLIELSKTGKHRGKYFVKVDDEDFDELNKWLWTVVKSKNTCYAIRSEYSTGKAKYIYMHRQIMDTPDNMDTDHKDHDGLNCQKNNLRVCSHIQNTKNGTAKKNTTSTFKGVSLSAQKYISKTGKITACEPKWRATIQHDKKYIHIGCFDSEIEAAIAYNKRAVELHGEFANLNKVAQ